MSKSENYLPVSENITQVTLLVLDGTNTFSFAAAVDPLRAANRHAGRTLYTWQLATPTAADSLLTSGVRIPAEPIQRIAKCDFLIVIASFDLERQCTPHLLASLRRLARAAKEVAGVDGGPWVLAQAGLLAHHSATTHWEDLDRFETQFPEIHTVNARVVSSGQFHTAAGAAPTLDMLLARISVQHGPTLARKVAGSFILDTPPSEALRQPNAAYPAPPSPRHERPQSRGGARALHTPSTARAHALMEAHLDAPLPLTQIALQVGVSLRALQLHFKRVLGVTPQQHYLRLRLEEAERLVRTTTLPLQDIALSTGFTSQSSFARAYRAARGCSARADRQR